MIKKSSPPKTMTKPRDGETWAQYAKRTIGPTNGFHYALRFSLGTTLWNQKLEADRLAARAARKPTVHSMDLLRCGLTKCGRSTSRVSATTSEDYDCSLCHQEAQ